MAKKKASSRNSNVASNEQQQQTAASYQKPAAELSREFSMEEDHDSSEEKFQNLKSLNAILLKQTVERRQQIETLPGEGVA
ncbi:hypothetical protein Bca52824_094108 [Brassica carinata]|uniref:Uncharacterized protein n=1 Tax=Brassica carinata TaxID=52824 RepID=A0A8X7P1A5_BRACI|nr:hypothetical protein Bca52824_094108 [Brassica carinata]